MRRNIRIGTRGSFLALAQAGVVKKKLEALWPGVQFSLVVIKTTGDEFQSVELFKKTHVGVFTKALEKKLLKNKIDVAVHSLKDLPTELPGRLCLAAFPKRQDARDVLISRKLWSLATLPAGSAVGAGSPRRKRQILRARPDLKLIDIRGNLDTRVKRVLEEKKYDAIVVARAGLLRIGKYLKYAQTIPVKTLLPAVGQASLGIEVRSADKEVLRIVRRLNHAGTEKKALAERELLKELQGGCRVPIGVHSEIRKGKIYLKASVFSVTTQDFVDGEIELPEDQYRNAGRSLAKRLLKKGAGKFLKEARSRTP